MRTNPGRKFPALLASKSGKWQKTEKIEDQIVAIAFSIPVAELCCRLPGAVPEDSQSSSPGPLHLSSFPSQVSAAKPPAYRSPALGHPEPPHSRAVHYGRSGLIHWGPARRESLFQACDGPRFLEDICSARETYRSQAHASCHSGALHHLVSTIYRTCLLETPDRGKIFETLLISCPIRELWYRST